MRMEFMLLQAGNSALIQPVFLILFIGILYFFMIRPQNQRQKAQVSFQDELEKGDEVVTASGIIGKVNKIEENVITLQVDQKTFIRVTKSAVSKEMTESTFTTSKDA